MPIAMMAAQLNLAAVDLGCERDVLRELHRAGFPADQILAGLDLAIDRARAERAQSDTPLLMVRNAAAAVAIVACVWLLAGPVLG